MAGICVEVQRRVHDQCFTTLDRKDKTTMSMFNSRELSWYVFPFFSFSRPQVCATDPLSRKTTFISLGKLVLIRSQLLLQ